MKKLLIGIGVAGGLALALVLGVVGFWFSSTVFAQGPTPNQSGAGYAACHDDSAVLNLLGMTRQELLSQRQAGKSLLDIAKSKNVDQVKLIDALMQPVSTMHAWMSGRFGNQNLVDQMTQQMRDWITKDIQESKLGTMTDFRLGLSGNGGYGMMGGFRGPSMMGGANGYGGMMGGASGYGGMMGGANGFNGMMGGSFRRGGMMGGWR
jgi:hypothetical protein